jgi:hypothetical protein
MGMEIIINDDLALISDQSRRDKITLQKEVWASTWASINNFRTLILPFPENFSFILKVGFQEKTFMISGEAKKRQVPKFCIQVDFQNGRRESIKVDAEYAPYKKLGELTCEIDCTQWTKTVHINTQEDPSSEELAYALMQAIWTGLIFFNEKTQEASEESQNLLSTISEKVMGLPSPICK